MINASELRYRRLFESSKDGILILDAETGMINDVNPFLTEMLGYSHEKFIVKSIWELGFLKDIVANKDNFEELKSKEYIRYEDMPLETADGRLIEVEFIGNVYLVDNKKVIQCNIRDITERRKIENRLEKTRIELEAIKISEVEAREYAESIISTVREPLLTLDQDLRVVTASRAFYTVFKVTPKDTVGQLIYDLGNKQWDIPKLRELLESILPQKATFDNYVVEHNFTSIGNRIMILNGRQIQRVSGKERIILLSIEDITERKRVEEALQVSETTYRRLFESAKDGILILDVESGMIDDVNPFLIELLGYSREQFLGKAIWELGFFKDIVANKDNFEELQIKEYIRYEDMPLETADGRRINVEFVSNVYLVNNKKVIQCNIRDITDRKRMEDEIRSLAKFPMENPNPIFRILKDGSIAHSNPVGDTLLREHNLANAGGRAPNEWLRVILRSFESMSATDFDVQLGGKVYTFSVSPVADGGYANLYGHDITGRKLAEETLRTSEKEFRLLAEAMPQIVWITRPDGWNIYFSHQWVEYTGQTLEESYGHGWNKPFHPDDQQRAWDAWQNAVNNIGIYVLECRLRRFDGIYKWWLIRGVPVLNADGTILKWFGTCTDIDEFKRAEEELGKSEATFRAVAELSPMAIYASSGSDQKGVYANEAFYKIFGFSMEDVPTVGHWWIKAFPDEKYRQQVIDQWTYNMEQANKNNTDVETLECVSTCKDGSEKNIAWVGKTIGDEFWAFGYDLTERKQAEAENAKLETQLRQSKKMEAVGRLAGGIAHDFNNMLTVINNYAEFVIAGLRPGDPLRSDVEEILKAGQRSADLTRQLLAFSRKQVLTPKILNINKIVGGISPMLRRLIGEDIDLIAHTTDGLGKIKADPGQIEQVIMNLAVNSRDAMPEGGKLTIETANVELDEEYAANHSEVTPGQYVMMSITDTGCGIDAQIKEHIFEPFYTTKEVGRGTGLGLSTVYGIVKQSGGHIWVYSEHGKGTTFKIYLPRDFSEAESISRSKKKDKPTTGTETILVVEDEPGVLSLVKRVLEASGYTIHTAANGGEALLVCERAGRSFDLLITDVVMPNMGGRELTERLSTICPNLKVLYMSGYTEDAIVHSGILDQGINFITKPFSLPNLKDKVREVLDMC